MWLLLAMFKHETNTFSPVPTPFERFFRRTSGVLCGGKQAIDICRGTGSGIGGFIGVVERLGAQIVLPVAAEAWPQRSDGLGVTMSDYSQLEFKNVRRPIYPLDPI